MTASLISRRNRHNVLGRGIAAALVVSCCLISPAALAENAPAASAPSDDPADHHVWDIAHNKYWEATENASAPMECSPPMLTADVAAGQKVLPVTSSLGLVPDSLISIDVNDTTRVGAKIAKIIDAKSVELAQPLNVALTKDLVIGPPEPSIISLNTRMRDVEVVCRILSDYKKAPDVPLKLVDTYSPLADQAWRQEFRNLCNDGSCAAKYSVSSRTGIDPSDTEVDRKESPVYVEESRRSRIGYESYGDWNRPDRTVVEFEWTPCTPYLVDRAKDQWRRQHLNIVTSGTGATFDGTDPSMTKAAKSQIGARLPSPQYTKTSTTLADVKTQALQNVCLQGVTVRSAIRDRWANYVHAALRENPLAEHDPKCPDCGPLFRDTAGTAVPHSSVTDVSWKNTWLDRQQWLVLLRDHFLARLKTEGLDPNFRFDGAPARLVYCGPEVRYGGIPSGRQYYWHHPGPGNSGDCYSGYSRDFASGSLASGYKELTISFEPDATLILSRGPLFHGAWERAQSRFVGRAVEQWARYNQVAPLVQNDNVKNAVADEPVPPMPAHPNKKQRNQEAPRREAVTPRIGDVFQGRVSTSQ